MNAPATTEVHAVPKQSERTMLKQKDELERESIIEAPDPNYIEEVSKPPYLNSDISDALDHVSGRKWVEKVLMKLPRVPPLASRTQPQQEVRIENVNVTYGNDGEYSIRVCTPSSNCPGTLSAAVLMFHGGGWIHSHPEVDEDVAVFFASELNAICLNVDYRLAPEHKYPAALNDCYHALQWTVENAARYGIDPVRISIWGCSAGGNLAAAVALRDASEHEVSRICHTSLVVPATCHPGAYPDILQNSECSAVKFGGRIGQELLVGHTLSTGDLRIGGHGKLAGIASTLFNIASKLSLIPACGTVLRDLVSTVSKADHERLFTSEMSRIDMYVSRIPRPLRVSHEEYK